MSFIRNVPNIHIIIELIIIAGLVFYIYKSNKSFKQQLYILSEHIRGLESILLTQQSQSQSQSRPVLNRRQSAPPPSVAVKTIIPETTSYETVSDNEEDLDREVEFELSMLNELENRELTPIEEEE